MRSIVKMIKKPRRHKVSGRHPSIARLLAGEVQKFILRIAFHGVLYFDCPVCGAKNMKRLTPFTWWVRCSGSMVPSTMESTTGEAPDAKTGDKTRRGCNRVYIPFMGLIPVGRGRVLPPSDFVVVDGLRDAYPMGEYIREPRWLSGDPVHRVDLHPSFCCLHKQWCSTIDLQSIDEDGKANETS